MTAILTQISKIEVYKLPLTVLVSETLFFHNNYNGSCAILSYRLLSLGA